MLLVLVLLIKILIRICLHLHCRCRRQIIIVNVIAIAAMMKKMGGRHHPSHHIILSSHFPSASRWRCLIKSSQHGQRTDGDHTTSTDRLRLVTVERQKHHVSTSQHRAFLSTWKLKIPIGRYYFPPKRKILNCDVIPSFQRIFFPAKTTTTPKLQQQPPQSQQQP